MIEDHDEISFFPSFRNVAVPSLAGARFGCQDSIQADGLQRWGLLTSTA